MRVSIATLFVGIAIGVVSAITLLTRCQDSGPRTSESVAAISTSSAPSGEAPPLAVERVGMGRATLASVPTKEIQPPLPIQPQPGNSTAVQLVPTTALEKAQLDVVLRLQSALNLAKLPVELSTAKLPQATWDQLERLERELSVAIYEQEKLRGPLMESGRELQRKLGTYEEYVHPDTIKDLEERKRQKAIISAASVPRDDHEQLSIGGGDGKIRVYRIPSIPGSELFEIRTRQLQLSRQAAENAAAAVLPYVSAKRGN